jgi:hypothetical protein
VEEYYKHDAKFGDEMIRVQNAHDLTEEAITKTNISVTIVFPTLFAPNKIKEKYPYIDRL